MISLVKYMKSLLAVLVAIVASVSLMSESASAENSVERQRFSLAISGGASKGAYEAGLNWALLKLARASEDLYALNGGQVRPLELVSIAGASAGGVFNTYRLDLVFPSRVRGWDCKPN
jgi:hypothetical protein